MIFLILHLVITLLVTLVCSIRSNKQEIIFNTLTMLFFPIGGIAIVILFRITKNRAKKIVEDDEFEEEIFLFTNRVSKESYKNTVSIEETLILNENTIKREQLIEQLKKDALSYISVLKKAIRDDDIETSHYASSAIVEVKRRLELDIQQFSVNMEKNRENIEFLYQYQEVLKVYIDSGILDKYSLHNYSNTYEKILKTIISLKPTKEIYHDLINILIKMNNLEEAEKYCHEFLDRIPSEESYMSLLKYYFNKKDSKQFNRVFRELKESKIQLSPKGIDLIRFWERGGIKSEG